MSRLALTLVLLPMIFPRGDTPPGPKDVAPDEIAALVVDSMGKPVSNVPVEMFHWVPDHKVTKTGPDGIFRFKGVDREDISHIRVRPEGFAWQEFMEQKAGETGWTVVLRNDTRFEGRVLDLEGKPVAGALVVADEGPRRARGYMQGQTLTDVTTGSDGRYTLFTREGAFDIAVRVPGIGVARLNKIIKNGETIPLDLKLTPGVKFLALCLDHETQKPVPGVKLSHWMKAGIEGVSDDQGLLLIRDVPPGKYPRFQVDAKGFSRWWSPEASSEWSRYDKGEQRFRRNFDGLDYAIDADFKPVTIELEKSATIKGRVLDPYGKPVEGATVAPAATGTGNSLTGDTRFSVLSGKDGLYECALPASGAQGYNLIVHDGGYGEWRTWANGVSGPLVTSPGKVIESLDMTLSRPATITGLVVDMQGKPVAGREVRSVLTSMDENRYYDPTVKTDKDGKFTIKHVRPGENAVQVAPFWLRADQAPNDSSQKVTLKAGEVAEGVKLLAQPER